MEAPECPASEWPHCLGRDEPVVGTDSPTQFPSFAHLGGLVTTCSPYTSREKLKCPFALRKKKKKDQSFNFFCYWVKQIANGNLLYDSGNSNQGLVTT